MKFSERYGFRSPRAEIQKDAIDLPLRNGLWNCLDDWYWALNTFYDYDYHRTEKTNSLTLLPRLSAIAETLWRSHFRMRKDQIPERVDGLVAQVSEFFFKTEWHNVYDLLEFMATVEKVSHEDWKRVGEKHSQRFREACNHILKGEMSAYRFVGEEIVEITSENEIVELEKALSLADRFQGVRAHLETSLRLMADRKSPDYRNSIKEAISAVESACKEVSNNPRAAFSDALRVLEGKGKLHGALRSGFSSLFGYTSDADGIRHAMMEEPNLSVDDARFMLVACSAFVNYLIAKSEP